ncbi:hypothetical protein M5C99_18580 [Acidovorax sp. NCPPB 2350]|nr:hypothetical protein M5C99_18580 [Acidovorax sp. NCPPB 2350]
MARSRKSIEIAAGKLIAAIQKEWHSEAGEPESADSERVMHAAHELLLAAHEFASIETVVGSGSVSAFLGEQWVQAYPLVVPYIAALEDAQ